MVLRDESGEEIEIEERDVPVVCDALRDSAAELEGAASAADKVEQGAGEATLELSSEELQAVRTVLGSLPSKRN